MTEACCPCGRFRVAGAVSGWEAQTPGWVHGEARCLSHVRPPVEVEVAD